MLHPTGYSLQYVWPWYEIWAKVGRNWMHPQKSNLDEMRAIAILPSIIKKKIFKNLV